MTIWQLMGTGIIAWDIIWLTVFFRSILPKWNEPGWTSHGMGDDGFGPTVSYRVHMNGTREETPLQDMCVFALEAGLPMLAWAMFFMFGNP